MESRSLSGRLAVLLLFLAVISAGAQEAAPGGADRESARLAESGEAIFQQKCSPCHALGGGDRPTGPDLAGVTERRDRQWLARFIRAPEKMIAEDPAARQLAAKYPMAMPDLGLSESEIEAVLAFLAHPQEVQHGAAEPGAPAPPAAPGNPQRGEALFIGTASLKNGGAPCLACHGIAGHGLAGGSSFGPDLTAAYTSYGPALGSILENIPFPSMQPIYSRHPLTPEERADLTAFLAEVSGKAPQVIGALALHAGIGAVVFFLILLAAGWRRLRGVRASFVEKAGRQSGGEPR